MIQGPAGLKYDSMSENEIQVSAEWKYDSIVISASLAVAKENLAYRVY